MEQISRAYAMILHLVRNPDALPDLEVRDQDYNLIATVHNQTEGDSGDQTEIVAEFIVETWNSLLGK